MYYSKTRSLALRIIFRCSNNNEKVNFGYKKVNLDEKQGYVNNVFHSVAQKYDVMNDIMSFGVHRCWKSSFVDELGTLQPSKIVVDNQLIEQPVKVLDVAGGTGDIAFRILHKFYDNRLSFKNRPGLKVTVLDINQSMLDVGKKRVFDEGFTDDQIEFVQGNAEELPYEDNTFDAYTIAFGIRNVPRIDKAISEAYRVLKKGGKFQILEFSKVTNPVLAQLNNAYQFTFLPIMGQLIANDKDNQFKIQKAESIDKFHSQEELLQLIINAGFKYANYKNYTQGVVAYHYGFKL